MKLSLKIVSGLILILLASPIIFLNSCGKAETTAPFGGTITINPTSFSWKDGLPAQTTHDELFTVTVKDAAGQPMNKTKINISFVLAVPDFYNFVQFVDSSGNLVNSPFDAVTDDFGTYTFTFRFQSGNGLAYFGGIEVRSGTAFQSSQFTVTVN
jgi:hypothetical protein